MTLRTWETEAKGSQVQGQRKLNNESLPKKTKQCLEETLICGHASSCGIFISTVDVTSYLYASEQQARMLNKFLPKAFRDQKEDWGGKGRQGKGRNCWR